MEFSAHHFDIAVSEVPVSPALVGSIVTVEISRPFTSSHNIVSEIKGPCRNGARGCTDGLVLPARFSGSAHVFVGWPA